MIPKVIAYLLFDISGFCSALFLQEDVLLLFIALIYSIICRQIIFLLNLQRVGSLKFVSYASSLHTEKGQSQQSHIFGEFLNSERLLEVWLSKMVFWDGSLAKEPCVILYPYIPQFPFTVLLCRWPIAIIKHFIKSWFNKKKINVNIAQTNTVRRNIWMSTAVSCWESLGTWGF